uniref:OSJNBa0042N22.14 protein n=1 Tax=Oryza sativa subsp. japonica TaxID=39947 RepID=Q7XPC6_ORYSJ|nr:OSJNBa0042N22.14 [Oryza sativa Japonica Group]
MAMVIESRNKKRKRVPRREGITYGPIDERDRKRFDYLNDMIWKNEQVAMFLHTFGHNVRNRVVATNFYRSGETISRYFNLVLHAVGELRKELIRPPSITTPSKILGNPMWDPYFKDCIGAIDGTHVRVSVTKDMELSFRGRKDHATQNVMAAIDFDLKFTYVLAGWETTAHDAVVLRDSIERTDGLRVPQGKFYLVDVGYGAKPGFLPPFRGVRYHLNEWGSNPVQNEKELFNLRHSSLRVTVARAFRSLKRRWKILDDASPFFPYPTQVDIVWLLKFIYQITNHIRTWKRKYSKIADLRKLSAALWDDDNFIISLDHKHYADHINDHKADAEYLNKPIHNYGKMLVIFGNSLATEKYAKGSGDPLAIESIPIDDDEEEEIGIGSAGRISCPCCYSLCPTQ